ncbi:MAG TPA: hypothetical protein DDZ22_14795, partial [Massilia sp.]|nr:hypothetical protein [Massilia sp.]
TLSASCVFCWLYLGAALLCLLGAPAVFMYARRATASGRTTASRLILLLALLLALLLTLLAGGLFYIAYDSFAIVDWLSREKVWP